MDYIPDLPGGSDDGGGSGRRRPNSIFNKRWRILGVLGRGERGTVYQARDLNFPDAKRLVAIKEIPIPVDWRLHAQALENFSREAEILTELSHPAIPKIIEFFDSGDRAYLVMEFISGTDLEMLITKVKELPIEKVIDWSIDLCDALNYLHSHQSEPIIFRDLRPGHVMIDGRTGKVRLIDFGLPLLFFDRLYPYAEIYGTPDAYAAPEEIKDQVTPLSDIYSLGATLHHTLTRKDPRLEPPFSFQERPIKQFNPNVPDELVAIVDKAVTFDAKDRWQSAADMKVALQVIQRKILYNRR